MADDQITAERQALLDEVAVNNAELARLGVATRLPMTLASQLTVDELRMAVRAQLRHYLDCLRQLGGV